MRNVLIVLGAVLFIAASVWFLRAPTIQPQAEPQPATATTATPAPTTVTTDASKAPDSILFEASNGNVTFDHKKHYERVNGDCAVCHPKVFPQSRAPLNYKKASHRASEASLTSCAHCHAVGATAFAADSNCLKCHVKDYSKQ